MKKRLKASVLAVTAALLIPTTALAAGSPSVLWAGNITDNNKGTYTPTVNAGGSYAQACVSNNTNGNTVVATMYEVDDKYASNMGSIKFTTTSACIKKSLSGWKDGSNKKAEIKVKIKSAKKKTVYVKLTNIN